MNWLPQVKAVIQTWYLGSETGDAIADIISGDVNPSGKLPFTFPVRIEDNGAISFGKESYPGDSINVFYKEDILVGYRWNDTKKIRPRFAFGYGLSYTTFNIANVKTNKQKYSTNDTIHILSRVTNTGKIKGSEVVQVYIGKVDSKVERAAKELKGFSKVLVDQGATKDVEILIDVKNLAYYDEKCSNWQIETGEYQAFVGNASDNISKVVQFTIKQ